MDGLSTLNKEKSKIFKDTVTAVHRIVQEKLYKNYSPSLEAYFKEKWKMSRAQVYRYLDCVTIFEVCCFLVVFSPLMRLSIPRRRRSLCHQITVFK